MRSTSPGGTNTACPPAAERYPSRSDATTAHRAAMPSSTTMPNDSPRRDGAHRHVGSGQSRRHFIVTQACPTN